MALHGELGLSFPNFCVLIESVRIRVPSWFSTLR